MEDVGEDGNNLEGVEALGRRARRVDDEVVAKSQAVPHHEVDGEQNSQDQDDYLQETDALHLGFFLPGGPELQFQFLNVAGFLG